MFGIFPRKQNMKPVPQHNMGHITNSFPVVFRRLALLNPSMTQSFCIWRTAYIIIYTFPSHPLDMCDASTCGATFHRTLLTELQNLYKSLGKKRVKHHAWLLQGHNNTNHNNNGNANTTFFFAAFHNDDTVRTDSVLPSTALSIEQLFTFLNPTTAIHGAHLTLVVTNGLVRMALAFGELQPGCWAEVPIALLVKGTFLSLTLPCFFQTDWWLHCTMTLMFQKVSLDDELKELHLTSTSIQLYCRSGKFLLLPVPT